MFGFVFHDMQKICRFLFSNIKRSVDVKFKSRVNSTLKNILCSITTLVVSSLLVCFSPLVFLGGSVLHNQQLICIFIPFLSSLSITGSIF